jgi:thiol-disulfide isomerase/thioredoxin
VRAPIAATLFAAAMAAQAAPAKVEAFGPGTWAATFATVKQPTAVVFSATYCATCPQALLELAAVAKKQPARGVAVVAVVTDATPGEQDAGLMKKPHYRAATRLFAFDGAEQQLRWTVDPLWRGVTPFIVLLAPGRAPQHVTGTPTEAQLAAWLAPAPAR